MPEAKKRFVPLFLISLLITQTSCFNNSCQLFIEAGVQAEKLVKGVPFYGRSWIRKSPDNHGINMPVEELARGAGFVYCHDSRIRRWPVKSSWLVTETP